MANIKLGFIAEASKGLRMMIALSNLIQQYKVYTFLAFSNSVGGSCVLIYSFYHFRSSSDDLAGVAYNVGLLNAVFVLSISGQVGKIKLFKIFDDSYCSYDYNSSIMKTKLDQLEEPRAKALKRFFKTLLYLTCGTQTNLTGLTIVIGLLKKEPIYLFPCWHPFDINNIICQIGILFWQQFVILSITFVAFGGWALVYISYSHLKTEISLLEFALKNLRARAHEMMNNRKSLEEEGDDGKFLTTCYKECIRMCAEHHSEIISYFSNGRNYLGIFYTTAFVSGGTACTFGGYYISSDNIDLQFKYLAMTLFILCYLYILFWLAEEISGKFLTIAETIFTMEWYNLPKECQSTLRLMQLRSNHPMFYQLVLGQRVDMEAYMSLVKATYYYLNIIIT